MRIGVVGSGYDTFPLFQLLHTTQHEYHFFCDRKYWPWGVKSAQLRNERIQAGTEYLTETVGVDKVIVPPLYELEHAGNDKIMPLFKTYLLEHCFRYSIVGKLGLLGEYADMETCEGLIGQLATQYTPTDNQKSIKKFHQPFVLRKKELPMRTYFLTTFGKRDWMVRKAIKYDLRYFKDAAVDTLIPLNWGFFFYDKIIQQQTNRKKIRLHGLKALAEAFDECIADYAKSDAYSLHIYATDQMKQLVDNKKRQRVLSGSADNVDLHIVS